MYSLGAYEGHPPLNERRGFWSTYLEVTFAVGRTYPSFSSPAGR
jgi:hypothetical protein